MTGREFLIKSCGCASKELQRRSRARPDGWMSIPIPIPMMVDGSMALLSCDPRHGHAALCHFGKSRNFSSAAATTASSISTPVLSSSLSSSFSKSFQNKYHNLINEAAQKGNSTVAERLLLEMHQEYNRTRNVALQPTRFVFGMVLNAWAQSGSTQAPQRAESILRHMLQLHQEHQFDTKPDLISYSCVINCWAKSEQPEAAEKSLVLLREMQSLWKQGHDESVRPNAICYNTVMTAYARRGQAVKVEELFQEMYLDYATNGNESAKPTAISFNVILHALSKSKSKHGPERAETMLMDMVELHQSGILRVDPTTGSYNSVIHAFANCNVAFQPKRSVFRMVLDAWAKSGLKVAPQRAESLFRRLWQLHQEQQLDTKPDVIGYSVIMNCWAQSGQQEAAEKSLALLREMQSLWNEEQDETLRPSAVCYNTVMTAYAKKGQAAKAEALLEEMYLDFSTNGNESARPTLVSFNVVLHAWSKCKSVRAPERAEMILMRMVELHQSGKLQVDPTTGSYNCVLQAWAKSSQANAAEQAEAVFRKMQSLWKQGHENVRPNVSCYNTVMSAYARRGQVEKAEGLLQEMYRDSAELPDTRSYTIVLDAWAKSKLPHAPQRAESILATMWELYESTKLDVKPNTFTYTSMMYCWSMSKDGPEQVERLLADMKTRSSAGDGTVRPDNMTYTAVMTIWSGSQRGTQAVQRVLELLQEMLSRSAQGDENATPNAVTFNVVLRTISFNTDATDEEKRLHAMEILRLMSENDIAPDHWTIKFIETLNGAKNGRPKYTEAKDASGI